MKGFENSTYVILYLVSNIAAIFFLIIAWKLQRLGRLLFFLLFAWAGWTNWNESINRPENYLGNAELAFIDVYRQFILGWFSRHITMTVGFIATVQVCIAISMLLRGWVFKLGAIAAIIFFLAIMPLGVGSAFPCTLLLAIAMFMLLRYPLIDYIWRKPAYIVFAD